MDSEGCYESKFIEESHQKAKAMLQDEGSGVTSNVRVIFARMWSDGFEAFQIKGKNEFNSLQLFTITLLASQSKDMRGHTLPFALCFKKKSYSNIFIMLLTEVHELETVQWWYFGKNKQFHKTVVFIEIVSNDYPERCANASIAQLGTFTHR